MFTSAEKSILLKGLKFTKTPGKPDFHTIQGDLKSFERKRRLKSFFSKQEEENTSQPQNTQPTTDNFRSQSQATQTIDSRHSLNDPQSKFKKRSKWEPNQYQRDPVLETFLSLVGKDENQHIPRAPRSQNLSQEERESLKT